MRNYRTPSTDVLTIKTSQIMVESSMVIKGGDNQTNARVPGRLYQPQ